MKNYIYPSAKPFFGTEEKRAVEEVMNSGKLSQGAKVEQFELQFAEFIGARYAVMVSSGTAALHLALAAAGIDRGDEVIIPSLSFISTAYAVLYQGGIPVFCDIDPSSFNMNPPLIEKLLSKKTKAVIPVHYAGNPVDMKPLLDIADDNDLIVIEDAAEAHGATYKGIKCGNLGHMGCFSFFPNKVISTGEGGMITTNDSKKNGILRKMRAYGRDGDLYPLFGFNYKSTELQAAIGIAQLKKIGWALKERERVAASYAKKLSGLDVGLQSHVSQANPSHTFFAITCDRRDTLVKRLESKSVETKIYFPPIHRQFLFRSSLQNCFLPHTDQVAERILNLPIHPELSETEIDYIVSIIADHSQRRITPVPG